MARKLKTYQTSLGFFDLAMAAPSMKAALEAWGADSNLFHQGAAKESDDPDVIAAAMAKPGVVLRRPVGTDRPFSEHAELPTDLGGDGPTKAARKSKGPKAKKPSSRPVDTAAERKAAFAFEKEQKRRQLEQAKEETARQKDRERRQQAIDKAQVALDKAEQEHAQRAAAIQAEVEALEKRSQTEKARWDSSAVFSTSAVKKAAYKYIKAFSADITANGSLINCALRFAEALKADEIERIVADFRKEVLDQDLRESLKKETEQVRNLILAHAFSKTALVNDE